MPTELTVDPRTLKHNLADVRDEGEESLLSTQPVET